MKKTLKSWILILGVMAFGINPTWAAEDVSLLKDMTSVIALLGLPCGQAVKAVKQGDNDHLVTCENGNRYRVYLNAEGRVVAQKQ